MFHFAKKKPIHTRCYVCRSYRVVTTPLSSERAVPTRYVCSHSKLSLITLTLTLAVTGSRIREPRPLGTLRLATQKQTTCQRRPVVKNKTIEGQNAWCECSAHRQTRSCPRKYPLLSPQVNTHTVIDMRDTHLFLRIFAKYLWRISIYCACNVAATYVFGSLVGCT